MTFNPQMLKLARVSRGMTLAEVATASGVPAGAISRAENVGAALAGGALAQVAAVLGYAPTLFEQDAPRLAGVPLFRKQAGLRKSHEQQLRAIVSIRARQIDALASSFDLPSEMPRIDLDDLLDARGRAATPAEAARVVRERWQVPAGPIRNMVRLVEARGAAVMRLKHVDDTFSGVSFDDGGANLAVILVAGRAPGCRDRWTVAHELGHVVLHHHRQWRIPGAEDEDDANAFAAELLMPAEQIAQEIPRRVTLDALAALKVRWRVSMQALAVQARRLGLISSERYTGLFKEMSRLGYRRREPVVVEQDAPYLVHEMVRYHLHELEYSETELARALWIQPDELRNVFFDEKAAVAPAPMRRAAPHLTLVRDPDDVRSVNGGQG